MSLQLSTVVNAVRNRHFLFDQSRVPAPVLASQLSDFQNQLIGKAVGRDKTYLTQAISIGLAINDANDPNVAGVNTAGGVPAAVSSGTLSPVRESAGRLVEAALTTADGVTIHVAERKVTSATDTATTSTGAARTVDVDIGRILVIVQGKGKGQQRKVTSNTADTWSHTAWTSTAGYVIPDSTSMMIVVSETFLADGELGVVTELPAQSDRRGYLVRLDSNGVAYVDYTKPLTLWVDRGVNLPSIVATIGGTVRYTDGDHEDLAFTTYGRRFDPPTFPAVYRVGETLHLCGSEQDWNDVESLEILYTPRAPRFAARADYFLVPDGAEASLIAKGAEFAAARVAGLPDVTIDVRMFREDARDAENDYLRSLRLSKRARVTTIREGDY